jgi:hypothetical protein
VTLKDVLGPDRPSHGGGKEIIEATLADGQPHPAADVLERLAAAGIPQSTAYRAADDLRVQKRKDGFQASSTWQIPLQPLEDEEAT